MARDVVGASDRHDRRLRRRGPQDTVGRAIASLLLLGGLSLLSVMTATITSNFVARAERMSRDDPEQQLVEEVRKLREEVERLRAER